MARVRSALGRIGHRGAGLAFTGIIAMGFLSVLAPGGPAHFEWYLAALGLTTANVVLSLRIPRSRRQRWTHVLPAVVATAAIGMLVYSAGTATGLTPLYLLPLVSVVLYGEAWESVVVIPAIAATVATVTALDGFDAIVLVRLVIFWTSLLTVISVTTLALRKQLAATATRADEAARQSALLGAAARTLTVLLDPELVIRAAVRIAAELASPPHGMSRRRAQYVSLDGDRLTIAADSDETGATAGRTTFPTAEHPLACLALSRDGPVHGALVLEACGPQVRRLAGRFGITHAAYVPVRLDARIHGFLVASSCGEPIPPPMFDRLIAVGNLTDLALANAVAHTRLELEASTDPLTGVANRRSFDAIARRSIGRRAYAMLAIDVDGLKHVNDGHGHAAGDALIVAVAGALSAAVRRGDTVARTGGDEFVVLAPEADAAGAAELARRIQATLAAVRVPSGTPQVSIGVCAVPSDTDPAAAQRAADAALYEAKRDGRGRAIVRELTAESSASIAAWRTSQAPAATSASRH